MSITLQFLVVSYFLASLACNFTSAHVSSYSTILSEQLNHYCDWRQREANTTVSHNAHRLKAGKAGPRGPRGPVGPAGKVNYTAVEAMISNSITAAGYDQKISELTEKVARLENELQKRKRKDCVDAIQSEAKQWNGTGGVFDIYMGESGIPTEVYCDLQTDGGGWIVIQRRMDGSENFERDFNDYVTGFGKNNREFWMGLEKIHALTSSRPFEMRVDLVDWENNEAYAQYSIFSIGDASSQFTLRVGGYSGTAGDAMNYHNGRKFYTRDRDVNSCSKTYRGAWWYNYCFYANLNGFYIVGGSSKHHYGVEWYQWRGSHGYSVKFAEMKIRPKW